MADIPGPVSSSQKQVPTQATGSTAFILAPPDPRRWSPGSLRHSMDLEPRIIAPPDPESRAAKKFQRTARHWADTCTEIEQADLKRALELVSNTMERYVDRRTGKIRMTFPFIEDDEYDPWRVQRDALRQASAMLFRGSLGRAGQAVVMQSIGERLIDFYEARNDDSDARFASVRPFGECLLCLAARMREFA
jgi:hypothetical protein